MKSFRIALLLLLPLVFSTGTFNLNEKFNNFFTYAQDGGLSQKGSNINNEAEVYSLTQSSSSQNGFVTSGDVSAGSGNEVSCSNNGEHKMTTKHSLKDIKEICFGSENQPSRPSPGGEDDLATLSIAKIIGCESRGGSPSDIAVCSYVLNNVDPSLFSFLISGNNPNPSNFPASEAGTDVSLDAGDYRIVENVDDEVIQSVKDDLNADELGVIPEFTGDCTQEVISFNTATGSVNAGDSVECNVTNQFIVQGGTVPIS
ncbi:hypothetical protein [Candidatus Nitrosocosmicus franklandus]|uniref:Uncharacterized protein n=1 Tax=Candidatus Nitrosocosmicus franklandianus TaxID=1798806 RepID=A0A484ID90_9ARCH|nr:hypothetical protein [Candidatus Nitrosocosmicus franklandus]VFJ14697.1 exported protein of unknown function [Candidatus Nitrosocosmicus franklandus]